MDYPLKTLSQLPLILKGLRKDQGVTQAAMAEKLGISQQSYAYFEANPARTTFDRLFLVLRILGVDITLGRTVPIKTIERKSSGASRRKQADVKITTRKAKTKGGAKLIKNVKSSATSVPKRISSPVQRRERW